LIDPGTHRSSLPRTNLVKLPNHGSSPSRSTTFDYPSLIFTGNPIFLFLCITNVT
jgi:hypothetical protein